MRESWETMTSVSAGHIILTPTQPVGSGRPRRESNPEPPYQESRALPTELSRPPSHTGVRNESDGDDDDDDDDDDDNNMCSSNNNKCNNNNNNNNNNNK